MAMYTAVNFSFNLKDSTPESVKALIYLLFNDEDSVTPELYAEFIDEPFFSHENFREIGWCTDCHFDDYKKSELTKDNHLTLITSTGGISYGDLYRLFLRWLVPYIDDSESSLIGYLHHECGLAYYILSVKDEKLQECLSSDLNPDFDPNYAVYSWPLFPLESPHQYENYAIDN